MWKLKCPFGGLFSEISDNDWFFGTELDWTCTKVKDVWEVDHGTFSDCINWDDEFLSFCDNDELIFVVDFGLRGESDDEFGFHTGGDFGTGLIFVVGLGVIGE